MELILKKKEVITIDCADSDIKISVWVTKEGTLKYVLIAKPIKLFK